VGTLLDEKKEADISILLAFLGFWVLLDTENLYKIETLTPVKGGVRVVLSNKKGELITVGNGHGKTVIDVQKCKRWFESHSCHKE